MNITDVRSLSSDERRELSDRVKLVILKRVELE